MREPDLGREDQCARTPTIRSHRLEPDRNCDKAVPARRGRPRQSGAARPAEAVPPARVDRRGLSAPHARRADHRARAAWQRHPRRRRTATSCALLMMTTRSLCSSPEVLGPRCALHPPNGRRTAAAGSR